MPERKKKEEKNVKISGTIRPDQGEWVSKKLKERKFYNKSHIIQQGIDLLQEREKEKK